MSDNNIIYDLENPMLCGKMLRGIRDAKDVLNSKWKTFIIGTLMYKGSIHFMQLMREVEEIAPRMLSKELQELELHQLIKKNCIGYQADKGAIRDYQAWHEPANCTQCHGRLGACIIGKKWLAVNHVISNYNLKKIGNLFF